MFGTLLSPALRWIGGILLVLSVIFGIYYKGRLDERKLFNAYKAEVKAAAMAQEERAKQIEAKNKRLNEEIANDYKNRLATLRAYYGVRLNKSGGTLPQVPGTTAGADGSTINSLPPIPTVIAQCAETTLTLTTLQDWIKKVASNMDY